MNLADLTSLLVAITGMIAGATASASAGAPWWVTVLFGVMGLIAGVLLAFVSGKIAYSLLNSDSGFGFLAYMLFPIASLLGSGALIVTASLWTLSHFGYSDLEGASEPEAASAIPYYGEPIETLAVDSSGRTHEIILTESRLQKRPHVESKPAEQYAAPNP